jgi:transposase-like protein
MDKKVSGESVVKGFRRGIRKKYSSEEKIRIVIDGLRGHRYMRYSLSEKLEIIRIVEYSELSVRQTLKELGIHGSTLYDSGKDRTLSSLHEECCQTSELFLPLETGAATHTVRGLLQQP